MYVWIFWVVWSAAFAAQPGNVAMPGMGKGGVTEVWLHLGNQTALGGNCYKQMMAASLFHWARTKQIPHSVKGETLHSCFWTYFDFLFLVL